MLQTFFAVTTSGISRSLYRVEANLGQGYPYAEKLALEGSSAIGIGSKYGDRSMLGICYQFIWYDPSKSRSIESVNAKYWGGNTSCIVALFLDEASARTCFQSQDLLPRDERWIEETRVVLNAIGDNHPVFFVSHWKTLGLMESDPPRLLTV